MQRLVSRSAPNFLKTILMVIPLHCYVGVFGLKHLQPHKDVILTPTV